MPTINIDREEELGINIKPEDRIPVRVDNSLQVKVAEPPLRINVNDPTKQVYEFKLNFRRALNGDYMIFDHNDIDIMILLEKKTVVFQSYMIYMIILLNLQTHLIIKSMLM